ncbi:MAG: hypothetical protein RL186_676 [Pseudomonadota bacterium]|jgi:UPF0755 protein
MSDPALAFRSKKAAQARSRVTVVLGGLAAFVFVLIVPAGFWLFGNGPKTANGAPSVFIVERGDGIASIAKRLRKAKLVRSTLAFRLVASMTDRKGLKPSEYEIPSGASPSQIAEILVSGEGIRRAVTLPEGWSVSQIYTRLAANEMLSGDLPPLPPEGSLNPDTYIIQRGDTRAAIIAKMRESQTKILDEMWLQRAPDLPFRTKGEAVVLASIVEKETGVAAERPRVAAVFINRLRAGMKLQSDPTIIYGITKGAPLRRKIFKSDLENPHPWNTYVIQGLPPTPIANPGKAALAAVLNPPKSKELFFVADGTGGHVFAETYAEHVVNVKKWRELRMQEEAKVNALDGGAAQSDAK